MKKFHNDWRKFLAEGSYNESNLLREISASEVELIQDAIDTLEPEDLPFNKLFGDKERIVIPFPTYDSETETGRFISFLTTTGDPNEGPITFDSLTFRANFETGMMTRARPAKTEDLVNIIMGGPAKERGFEKMKIGKWLAAVEKLVDNLIKNRQILLKSANNQDTSEEERAILERLAKTMEKLLQTKSNSAFLRRLGIRGPQRGGWFGAADAIDVLPQAKDIIQQMRVFWQKNADYLKKNPQGDLDDQKYSIIITRNPVDILRMSDFDNITSCHSPPSRSGGMSYFKCVVAEAHGEGALAYVVRSKDLQDFDVEEYEGRELFYDSLRDVGKLNPISRIRLRLVRKHDDENIRNAKTIDDIAVPETRVYGAKIPGLASVIMNWASENQQDVLKDLPILDRGDGKGAIEMKYFTKFGGSYEDSDTQAMLLKLAGLSAVPLDIAAFGRMNVNTEVEDRIGLETSEGRAQALLDEAEQIIEDYTNRERITKFTITADVDYDEESVWLTPSVIVRFRWDSDEWKALPRRNQLDDFRYEIRMNYGYEFDWLSHYGMHATRVDSHSQDARYPSGAAIVVSFAVNIESISESGMPHFYDAGEFEEFLEQLSSMEDSRGAHDQVKLLMEQYMKVEGVIDGGAVIRLGREVENNDKYSYEWDWEAEGGFDEFELVSASTKQIIEYSDIPGASQEAIDLILNTRDFWLDVRKRMHAAIHDDFKNKYFVDIERYIDEIDETGFEFKLSYFVGDDTPDEVVEIFLELIDHWDDEDLLQDLIKTVVAEFLQKTKSLERLDDPIKNINEHKNKIVSDKKLFNNWRNFLQGG